jgi:uncharacterized membrane protein
MTEISATLARYERPLRYAMGAFYVLAGVTHFLLPRAYESVVPRELPRPRAVVYLSGVVEVVLGIGVLVPRTRRRAALGIVALLVAVFPANLNMAMRDVTLEGVPERVSDPPDAALWARLPVQGLLVLWAWWHARESAERGRIRQ